MMRISTTNLEQFRKVIETPYGLEDELIASIKGKPFDPNFNMRAGTAWHTVLQRPLGLPKQWEEEDGFAFDLDAVRFAKGHVGPGVCEVKATRTFEADGEPVVVVAKADHCRGLVVQDHKTKFTPADAKDYETSLQWRFYLMVHGAACFRYNLFSFGTPVKCGEALQCELKDVISFNFWPYAGLESECRHWLYLFVDWARSRGLTGYLEREGTSPALPA
jgi:hypothetical protein